MKRRLAGCALSLAAAITAGIARNIAVRADAIRTQANKAWPTTLVVEDLETLGSLGLVQR